MLGLNQFKITLNQIILHPGVFVLSHRVPRQCERVESAAAARSVWSSLRSSGLPVDSGAEVLSPVGSGSRAAAAAG